MMTDNFKNMCGMPFKDFKHTDVYKSANVIYFVNTDGENCEDIDTIMDKMTVVAIHGCGGYLEITLDETLK
jgi:hypothetical protein